MKTKVLLLTFSTLAISALANPGNQKSLTVTKKTSVVTSAVSSFNPDLSFFRTHRQGKGVSVNWGVTASEEVAGFVIQRTYEDASDPYAVWSDIASVSCNASRSYKVDDENVFPGYISYRVVIVTTGGQWISSGISIVHIMSK